MTTVREYEELVGRPRPSVRVGKSRGPRVTGSLGWRCQGCLLARGYLVATLETVHEAARDHARNCGLLVGDRERWLHDASRFAPKAGALSPGGVIPNPAWDDAPEGARYELPDWWVVITPGSTDTRSHEAVLARSKSFIGEGVEGPPWWRPVADCTPSQVRTFAKRVPS